MTLLRRTAPRVCAALALALALALASRSGAVNAPLDGKKLFIDKGCFSCHGLGGPSPGPGPELTQVAYQRDAAWMRTWLANPPKVKKDTCMPKLPFKSQAEMDAVIGYLLGLKRGIPLADSTNGERLMADYLCTACHPVDKKGGKPQFPDLARPKEKRDAKWLDAWLLDPQKVKPGSFMATIPLTPTERRTLVNYLVAIQAK